MSTSPEEYAAEAIKYVKHALGVELDFTHETLPILDHYLQSAQKADASALALVAVTAGAYFGQVLLHEFQGEWQIDEDDDTMEIFLEPGLALVPSHFVMSAVQRADAGSNFNANLEIMPKFKQGVSELLERMSPQPEDVYYSLAGRFDTLAHIISVIGMSKTLEEKY